MSPSNTELSVNWPMFKAESCASAWLTVSAFGVLPSLEVSTVFGVLVRGLVARLLAVLSVLDPLVLVTVAEGLSEAIEEPGGG